MKQLKIHWHSCSTAWNEKFVEIKKMELRNHLFGVLVEILDQAILAYGWDSINVLPSRTLLS